MTPGWEWLEITSKFFSIATFVAVFFAVSQLIASRVAKHRDFENLYVQRYWNIMDGFADDPLEAEALGDLDPADQTRIKSYLQLCEDEIDLRENGFITTKTWGIWSSGMIFQCAQPAFSESLSKLADEKLPSLRRYIAQDIQEDPLENGRIYKWWTGIGNVPRK